MKKSRGRKKKVAGGAVPMACAPCGHSHCDERCHVRYVGAVSHPRDHHILTAARGASNYWLAAVITGFAIVMTGAIAYTGAQAKSTVENAITQAQFDRLMNRLQLMETTMAEVRTICNTKSPANTTINPPDLLPKNPPVKVSESSAEVK